ncbi:TIGR02444 family protein [Mesorhizobium denitrificans]|uniref:TIGR02444 family protein n=1 Tax=Mesorhizobium denitrificans TaxID=2294114 RepID=A0A371X9J2_9HYPH|nr:TIGR02444 family protein [Mesorhizobium denitrificans]RFC65876.1 TIGR02444 family protein [Mesorhizobium denitrificans]
MSQEESNLWNFMVEFYARPGVANACLQLQEKYKVDVPLFLAVLRAVAEGRAVSSDQIRALDVQCANWRETVIQPLRSVRTAMKAQSQLTDKMGAWELRENIKAIELRAEQLEIHRLERLIAELSLAESPAISQNMYLAARLLLETNGSIFAESLPTEANWIIDSLASSLDCARR